MAQAEGCGVNATENRFYREKADHDAAAGIKASHANAIAKLVMMRTYLTLEQQEAFDTEWLAKRGAISARSRAEAGLPPLARAATADVGDLPHPGGLAGALLSQAMGGRCGCRACIRERGDRDASGYPLLMGMMIVCLQCGNKRCPHGHHHANACTNSNEPGQTWSADA
jgi:hypothetical protein